MSTINDVPIHKTPRGVRIDLTLYMYPEDDHANLVAPGGVNIPLDSPYHVTAELSRLLYRARKIARESAKTPENVT